MRVWMVLMFLGSLSLTACGSRCPSGTYDNGSTCVYQSSYNTMANPSGYNNGYNPQSYSTYPSSYNDPYATGGGYYPGY